MPKNSPSSAVKTFTPTSRQAWREWLQANHATENAVWLIYHKKSSGLASVPYTEAVDEALCFGWIDSKAKPIDNLRYMQFFSKRKVKSVWSKVNKEKIEQLIGKGLMTKAGFDIIEIAKQNGSWTILDQAEALIVPNDLEEAFNKNPKAKRFYLNLSRSDKRNILQWLVLAKREETKQKRILEFMELANENLMPKQFRKKSTT